jgi:predicted N-acetyltransferase YhbS
MKENAIIGHIMFTRINIAHPNMDREALLLSPVCIAPDFHSRGLGTLLINEGLSRCANSGFKAVLVVGNPGYYGRFGFKAASTFNITNVGDFPQQYVQALELSPGYLGTKGGIVNVI